MRELLAESVLLGVLGGALGLGLAYGGLRLLLALAPDLPRITEITIDPVVLVFTLAVSLVSGLLFGILPAAKYGRFELARPLRGARTGTSATGCVP